MKKKAKNLATKVPNNALPSGQGRNITNFEYIWLIVARIGGMFVTTLTGTLAGTYANEVYFGPAGADKDEVARILAVQTTITTVTGILVGVLAGIIVQKWKSRWGRYRQWYIICMVPMLVITLLFFYVPSGWSLQQLTMFRYGVMLCWTVINGFNNLGQNVAQVISPDPKEKKTVATVWQLSYYLGYGGAYLGTFVFGLFSDNKYAMYMTLAAIGAVVTAFGNLMCGLVCRERIELPKKEKVKVSKELFSLFKYKNYRAYQYIQWATVFATLGKFSTLLAAITVGSSKNLLLTLPTAAGTVVGNVMTAKISKKHEPTKLLKFCGPYSLVSAGVLFAICFAETKLGLTFYNGWNSIFFYVFYFLFGFGIGIQELSTTHFNVEYFDYLEWQTGDRMEAIQGIVPGWIQTGLNYLRDLGIPFLIAAVGYPTSEEGDLLKTMENNPRHMTICLWLLAFLLFGYALSSLLRALILKFFYDVEGEKKAQMYRELEVMRAKRHAENAALAAGAEGVTVAVSEDDATVAVSEDEATVAVSEDE